jgi:hypothetical protein
MEELLFIIIVLCLFAASLLWLVDRYIQSTRQPRQRPGGESAPPDVAEPPE